MPISSNPRPALERPLFHRQEADEADVSVIEAAPKIMVKTGPIGVPFFAAMATSRSSEPIAWPRR